MPLVLVAVLFVASLALLAVKRSREPLLLLGLCASLAVYWVGILMFIAKRGGFGAPLEQVLFLNSAVRQALRQASLTLGQQGYLVALGRYLCPAFLLVIALRETMTPGLGRIRDKVYIVWLLPAVTLVVYYPPLFIALTRHRLWLQKLLVQFSRAWIVAYLLAALALLIYESINITSRFFRRRYLQKCVLLVSLGVLYALYCPQDPAQIYLFYQSDYMWLLGLWYLNPNLSPAVYVLVTVLSVGASAAGFYSLFQYTHLDISEDMDEVSLQRKFDAASMGASVFAHSIKNQLLANRVIYKRIDGLLGSPELDADKLRANLAALQDANEALLVRVEELYRSVKSNTLTLVPVPLGRLAENAVDRLRKKHPEAQVEVQVDEDCRILADEAHLSAALANLLANGWEATQSAGRGTPVRLTSRNERVYTMLEVRDGGTGIPRDQLKKIFDPFYSSKNSNYNWGMGLYYVRSIVKSHLGSMRVESTPGKGTCFFVLLPRFDHT